MANTMTAEEYLEERKRRKQGESGSKKQTSQASPSFSNADEYLAYREKRIQAENEQFAARARAAAAGKQEPALERDTNSPYIPAQFGQMIVDRERSREYAQRYQNTYVPASLAQNAIHRSGAENDFTSYSDARLRGEYLNRLDRNALQVELDALNKSLDADKQRYNRTKMQLASYGNNTANNGARALQKYINDYDAKQTRAAQLQRDINDSDAVKKYNAYESLRANADFSERSKAGKSKRVQFNVLDPSTWSAGDDKYDFVNDIDGYRNTVKFLSETSGQPTSYGQYTSLSHITDEEKAMYNYLYATQGKKAAEEYLEYIEEGLNYRQGKAEADIVGDNLLKAAGYGIRTGAERFGAGIAGMFNDEAKAPAASEYGAQFVRENLADTGFKLPEWMGGASAGQTIFDLSNTAGNLAPSLLLSVLTAGAGAPAAVAGGVSSASMGLSAGGNARAQALRDGYTPEQATRYGVLIGASEGSLQYLLGGIGKLGGKLTGGVAQKAIQNIDNSLLRIAATGAIKMAGEGTEEYLQEILDPIYRNLLFDENNQVNLADPEAVYSFMLGALTTLAMDGPEIIREGIARPSSLPNVNGAIVAADAAQNIQNEQTAMQNAAQETEQYVYTDETTGIPMVGTRKNIASEVTPEAIARNKKEVAQMAPVAAMDGTEFPKGSTGIFDQVAEFFQTMGNKAANAILGNVTIDRRGIKDSVGHGLGRNKAIAFKAVPQVIRDGKIIDYQKNWKGRGYDTLVLAAPVTIKSEPYYEGVILIRPQDSQRFYLHEVLAANEKDMPAPFKTGTTRGGTSGGAGMPSLISLLDEIRKVNTTRQSDAGIALNMPQTPGDAAEKTAEPLSAEQGQDTALRAGGQFDTISLEEEGAIRSYKSGMMSYTINEKLYSGMELDDADKTLVKNLDSALEKMPNYEGTTYRVLCFDRQGKDAYDAFIAQHVPNTTTFYGSYTSASKTPGAFDIDGTLKVRIEIEGKTGKDVSKGFGLEAEQEVLYGRTVGYITKAVETAQDGTPIIKIKEVGFNDEGILSRREESVDSANQGDETTVRQLQEVEGAGREGHGGVRGLSERDSSSAVSEQSRPFQGELSGRQRNSRGAEGSERSINDALHGGDGSLADRRAETTEHLRKLKRDVLLMEVHPERIYTDADRKALANKRITEYTADDIYLLASSLKGKKGLHMKDVGRVLDTVSGNRDVRQALHNLIEVGYNAALGEHGRRQSRDLTALQERYKKRGIKPGSKESAAVMKFGQRGYFDRNGEWVEYTLGDLQAEFPNKWKDIMQTAQEDRAQYDAYIDEANEMRERIYPKAMEQAQAELESAKETAARNSELAAHQKETIVAIEAKIESYREMLSSKKRTDTAAYAKLKNGIAYQERRLKTAQSELNRAEQRAEDARSKAARLAEEIKNGEPLHQRKIERRKDYYHHVRASGLAFDLATLMGTKSAASEMVAGRIAGGDAGGIIGSTIDKIIASVLGNKDIAPGMVGVSDNTSPRAKWQGIMEHQGAGAYKLDSFASMADYIGMIDYMLAFDEYTSQLRDITNTIQAAADRLDRSIGKSAREANSFIEWMKDWDDMLTGKTLSLDRGVQKVVGRNVMNGVRKLNSAVRSSTLLANIRSMIVQGSAIANAMNYIQNPADWARGMRYMANAMTGDAEYANAIAQSNFLSQRNMLSPSDVVKGNWIDRGKKPLGKMLNIGQNAADKLTWWTAYAQYNAAAETPGGLDKLNWRFTRAYDNAIDYADDITRRSVAGRGVGEQPMTVKSTVVDTLAPFQTEVLNNFNTLKETVGTLFGKSSTKEQRTRAAVGLLSYEIAVFAINLIAKGLFNDDILPFDFIGALAGALFDDEDEEDEENNLGKQLYYNAAGATLSGIPFASAVVPMLMDSETSQAIFGADGDPSRYGTGIMGTNALFDVAKTFVFDKNATDWEKINAAAAFFPLGGKQLARTAQGIHTVYKGGSYKTNAEGEEQLQYRTDRGALDYLQAGAFGKWALPEAREYVAKGFPILSAPDTTAYKNAIANGVDGAHFLLLLDEYKNLQPIKDADGNTEKSTKQQFREILFRDSSLTTEQKEMIDRDVIRDEKTADYSSSEAVMEASQLKGSHADKAKSFVASGGTAEKYLSYYDLYSELEPTKDINGEEIAGSREETLRSNIMNDDDLTPAQKRQLDEALTGGKTRDYTSRFAYELTKISKTAYKRGKAYVAAGISEAKAIQIEQWMKGREYKKADLKKYLGKLKLTDSEIEAVLEARY